MSLQRANQIKAKLGLPTSSSATTTATVRPRSWSGSSAAAAGQWPSSDEQAQQASSSSVSLEPAEEPTGATRLNDLAGAGQPLIGAPLSSIPKTDFECTDPRGRFVSGLFADAKTGCQVWHLCSNNRKYSFLCPSGTIFNSKVRICDWRYNVKCESNLPF